MNSVLFSPHSQNRPLKSLTLKFPSYSKYLDDTADCFTFDIWIEALKRRKVEKLDLSYLYYIPLVPTIFCCKTLVILKLTGITVATMLHCSVDLPLLKKFYLSDVRFEHINNLMKILSGCPKLLKLFTRNVRATTGVTTGGCIKPLSNLLYANIRLFEVPLRAVSNVEILTVTNIWMWEILPNEEINSYYKGYPVFENLRMLQLFWLDYGILDWDYDVMTMLQYCPKLDAFIISKSAKGKVDWKYPDHVPECVSSHLTTCCIYDYHAVEADFRFATYILQNANFLQVMNIHHSKKLHSMESPRYLEDLSSCPRISPDCKLSLEDDALFRYF